MKVRVALLKMLQHNNGTLTGPKLTTATIHCWYMWPAFAYRYTTFKCVFKLHQSCRSYKQPVVYSNCSCHLLWQWTTFLHIFVWVYRLCSLSTPVWDWPNLHEPAIFCRVQWDWHSRRNSASQAHWATQLFNNILLQCINI